MWIYCDCLLLLFIVKWNGTVYSEYITLSPGSSFVVITNITKNEFHFVEKNCKILYCCLHSTSTWWGLIFQCWWNAAVCWFFVTIHYCYSMWNGIQLNISLCHLLLHFLSLQREQTALHLASESGHVKVCQVLLQAGADVQAADIMSTIIWILSTLFTVENFIQSLISRGYLKNHWTNTRLVCTHLNAFFMLNPNYGNEKFAF